MTIFALVYSVVIAGVATANLLHNFLGGVGRGEQQFNHNIFDEFENDSVASLPLPSVGSGSSVSSSVGSLSQTSSSSSSASLSSSQESSSESSSSSVSSSNSSSSSSQNQPGRSPYTTTTVTFVRHDEYGIDEHPDNYDSRGYHVIYYTLDVKIKKITDLRTNLVLDAQGYPGDAITDKVSNQVNHVEQTFNLDVLGAISGDSGFSFTHRPGYVIRNATVFRSTLRNNEDAQYEDLALWRDGTMSTFMEANYTTDQLIAAGVWQTWMFGPTLVKNGQINVTETDEIVSGKSSAGGNQRTVIGYIEPYHYWMLVSQGRTVGERDGFSLYDLANRAVEAGCVLAYNLDGGGSSTIVTKRYDGKESKYKYPAEAKQRELGDMIYVVDA